MTGGPIGHFEDTAGRSAFRLFAPGRQRVSIVFVDDTAALSLTHDELGYWTGHCEPLAEGTRYWVEIDGERVPDIASRLQPDGVHAASAIARPRRARIEGWRGVRLEDAIIYELHLGTFTPDGTLNAAALRLPALHDLGVTVIELLPVAAFPGRWNWGYDGTFLFALQSTYGSYDDLAAFIEAAHAVGIAVLIDVVYNHFGPEGNYTARYGPYTRSSETPWGAAVNFNREYNHGIREFFLANARYWLQQIGVDGFRMDAVSMIFDDMPVHILREMNDLASEIATAEGREVLMIAEHLRNNRFVTADSGHGFDAQWNDDLTHSIFALITGERQRHYANHGSFDDVVKAFERGFVLDGTRFDHYRQYLLGTDGRGTRATEHIVYIQNHDQVGNRPFGDRMIRTHGRERSLLALTAMFASPFVPMLFMGDEYGESAPFLFFEDFSDPALIEGVRLGRRLDFEFGSTEPPDPHAPATFEASKLHWAERETGPGAEMLAYIRTLIDWKRSGRLGPRDRARVQVTADAASRVLRLETADSLTLLNLSAEPQSVTIDDRWTVRLTTNPMPAADRIGAYGAAVCLRADAPQ